MDLDDHPIIATSIVALSLLGLCTVLVMIAHCSGAIPDCNKRFAIEHKACEHVENKDACHDLAVRNIEVCRAE